MIHVVLLAALLLASCVGSDDVRVGELRTESKSVELGDAKSVDVDIILGAGKSTVDLSGGLTRDLDVTFDTGAANITVRLPGDVGVHVEVAAGVGRIEASGLTQDGYVYTNEAYGTSEITLQINIMTGRGQINLEVVE